MISTTWKPLLKNFLLLAALFTIVMLSNKPFFDFGIIYQEQTTIYLANQTIHSWHDLLNIYLHPKWLDINVPFFRPSGHFLIYQLFMPLFGWRNIFAMSVISFTMLTLIAFFMIKIYRLLFPAYQAGAYLAVALYLAHPALSVSRFTFMHFDFAYILFLVWSLYCFILFCQQHKFSQFIYALILYAFAITFKEPAIMLAPVMFCYYFLHQSSFKKIIHDKFFLFITGMLVLTCVAMGLYLLSSWPTLNYIHTRFHVDYSLGTANVLFKDIFGIHTDLVPFGSLPFTLFAWRTTVFTMSMRLVMWVFFWISVICAINIFRDKSQIEIKKSLLFLIIAMLLFCILPLCWGTGAPWHHHPTLIFLSLFAGFSSEYCLRNFTSAKKYTTSCCLIFATLIVLLGMISHFENIIKYYLEPKGFLGFSLNYNAIVSPPDIKHKLNEDSIVVVEDSQLNNDYFLGNSAYPYLLFFSNKDYDQFQLKLKGYYQQFHYLYSSNLFRYAYQMPYLKEELYPFVIALMDNIPNEILYNWLKHRNNIFCLGYDNAGKWMDKTIDFKAGITHQQTRRGLIVNAYRLSKTAFYPQEISGNKILAIPDEQLCQFACDQDTQCKGFVFQHVVKNNHHDMQCYFMRSAMMSARKCDECGYYAKV